MLVYYRIQTLYVYVLYTIYVMPPSLMHFQVNVISNHSQDLL